MLTRIAGWLLVPVIVALMRPGRDPTEFFLVFPLWLFLAGNFYFMVGSEGGIGYPLALLHYAAAVLVTQVPYWSPLIVAILASTGMLLDALYLRSLRE